MSTWCTLYLSPKDKGQHSVAPWVQEKWEWKMVGWMDIYANVAKIKCICLSGEFLLKKITKSHQFLGGFWRKTGESIWIEGEDGLIRVEEVRVYICQHSLWSCPLKGDCWEVYVCWATTMHVCVCFCACSMCAGVNNECSWVDWRDTQRPIRALCSARRALHRNKYLQTQQRCSLGAVPPKRKGIYYLNVVAF